MTPVTVRDARPEDAPDIARVATASWRDAYRDIFKLEYIDEFLATHYSRAALAAAIDRAAARADAHFLVAERDGQVVAYANYDVGERGPELWRIYAHPDQYGTGAGSALLDALEARLDVEGYVLDVHSRNERGRAFYDRRGFVIIGGGATPDCDLTLRRTLRPRRAELPVETDRLRIRSLEESDVDGLHAIYGDAETMRFIGRSGRPTDDLDGTDASSAGCGVTRSFTASGCGPSTNATASRSSASPDCCGRRATGPTWRSSTSSAATAGGGGTRARRPAPPSTWRTGPLGLRRVTALAYPENVASQRVMARAGMRPDGETTAYGRPMVRTVSER